MNVAIKEHIDCLEAIVNQWGSEWRIGWTPEKAFTELRLELEVQEDRIQEKNWMIQRLQGGLREVYALAGEDKQLAKIINETLEACPFP